MADDWDWAKAQMRDAVARREERRRAADAEQKWRDTLEDLVRRAVRGALRTEGPLSVLWDFERPGVIAVNLDDDIEAVTLGHLQAMSEATGTPHVTLKTKQWECSECRRGGAFLALQFDFRERANG